MMFLGDSHPQLILITSKITLKLKNLPNQILIHIGLKWQNELIGLRSGLMSIKQIITMHILNGLLMGN